MRRIKGIWQVLMDYGARLAQLERRIARLEAELETRVQRLEQRTKHMPDAPDDYMDVFRKEAADDDTPDEFDVGLGVGATL